MKTTPITSFLTRKSSAITTAFKMSLERYFWPTEQTDSKTLNERHFKIWKVGTLEVITAASISIQKELEEPRYKIRLSSTVHPKWQRATILLIITVDWESRTDMAGGKMWNSQVSWCTVTKRNSMEEKTKAGRWACLCVWKQKASS